MKVLVTGSSGYIGGQTAIQLKDHGHEVYGTDRRPLPNNLKELSMGMSNDYILAIKNGSTFVRIGSAIFEEKFN